MASVVCFEAVRAGNGGEPVWQQVTDPPYVAERSGMLVAELPSADKGYPRASVNGLAVVAGVQRVRPGDLVRVELGPDQATSYVVGSPAPAREPGQGRPCAFTGLPVRGAAFRCVCGMLLAEEVVAQLGHCPGCAAPLNAQADARRCPPEELL